MMNEYKITEYNCIGYGGTKTILKIDETKCVAIPNSMDGKDLIKIWPRIVSEELSVSAKVAKLNIPGVEAKKCAVDVELGNNENLSINTIEMRTFKSYVGDGLYIVDSNKPVSTTWPHDFSLWKLEDEYNWETWLKITKPLIDDIVILARNGIGLDSNMRNICLVKKGSKWHSGSDVPFEARVFVFGIGSKNHAFNWDIPSFSFRYRTMRSLIELVIFELLSPTKFCLSKEENELKEKLYIHYKPLIRIPGDSDDEYNNPQEVGCVIQ